MGYCFIRGMFLQANRKNSLAYRCDQEMYLGVIIPPGHIYAALLSLDGNEADS